MEHYHMTSPLNLPEKKNMNFSKKKDAYYMSRWQEQKNTYTYLFHPIAEDEKPHLRGLLKGC